ncbi:c2h2 finger domain-containing protein [Rutstroemia sp. NJR-2017a BVV2]|nr:c2h2 finger domain-containing protein [Rutstroemia sp. NJR-2017a BVV2]
MVGKKKRGHPDIEELLARPWCYYCERDFDDLKILISHQKAKHFKCERCGRRLNTAGGLSVHMNQVHKETLASVDNSLPNRQGLEVEIFGMEGIPEDVVQAHNQRIISGFYQAESERRAATGNPAPGTANANSQAKKPKLESPAELKKRLAEHKARKAEQAANSSGGNTPLNSAASPMNQSPGAFNASPFPPPQANYGVTQGAAYGSFPPEPHSQNTPAYPTPAYSGPPGQPYQPQFSPPPQYPPQAAFSPTGFQQPPQIFQGSPPYTAGSPPGSFNGYHPPPSHTPPAHSALPNRPPSLPPAPGLPQRPSFGAPQVRQYQMQQLHQQGGWAGNGWTAQEQNPAIPPAYPQPPGFTGDHATNASTVDDLVSGAAREADDIDKIIRMAEAGIKPPKKDSIDVAKTEAPENPTAVAGNSDKTESKADAKEEATEKKAKKDKPMKMIYSDNEVSPEEKMAKMPRYAFVPEGKTEQVLVDANTVPGVAGTVDN